MDAHLKTLADAGLALDAAEEAIGDGAYHGAREHLDAAAAALGRLRGAWPEMTAAERALIGRTAAPVRTRLDAATARLPRVSAVSEGAPEVDPEQDEEPAAA